MWPQGQILQFSSGGKLLYYSNRCHSSQCFHVIVLFSPDVTPLIHVPDLQPQAFQTEGNAPEQLTNQRRGRPCRAAWGLILSTAAPWGRGSGACLCTSPTRPWEVSTCPTSSHPPLPAPLATELRLSTKRNFLKRRVAPVIFEPAQWHKELGQFLASHQDSCCLGITEYSRLSGRWLFHFSSAQNSKWTGNQNVNYYSKDAKGSLGLYVSPGRLLPSFCLSIELFFSISWLTSLTSVTSLSHLPLSEHSMTSVLASTTKVVCSLMEGCKQQNYNRAEYKNWLNFFFFKLNLSGQHWIIRLCNFNPVFAYDQNIFGSKNDTEGPRVRGDRETLVHPTTSA